MAAKLHCWDQQMKEPVSQINWSIKGGLVRTQRTLSGSAPVYNTDHSNLIMCACKIHASVQGSTHWCINTARNAAYGCVGQIDHHLCVLTPTRMHNRTLLTNTTLTSREHSLYPRVFSKGSITFLVICVYYNVMFAWSCQSVWIY